jgi:predicted ATPase
MRITKLSLTNFRSFKQTQTIAFAPITLLFGPNSVGKSTVLMALFYLQQILDKGQCDAQRIEALGNKHVGGFKNLVHRRNVKDSITIKIEYDKGDRVGSSYDFLSDLIDEAEFLTILSSPAVAAQTVAVEFIISWSEPKETAYVANYKVWFDDIEIAEVTSDSGLMQPQITSINYLHPLLLPETHDEWLIECFDNESNIHNALFDKVLDLKDIYNPSHREIANGAERPFDGDDRGLLFTDNCYVSDFHQELNEERSVSNSYLSNDDKVDVEGENLIHVPIGIEGFIGAIPKLGRKLKTSLSLNNEKQNELFIELLSDLLVASLDNLKKILNDSLCIGPLREIPDALHQPNPYFEQKDWHNGLAAWDVLARADSYLINAVDEWISNSDKLGLGYGLAYKVEKHFEEYSRDHPTGGAHHAEMKLEEMIAEDANPTSELVLAKLPQSVYSYSLYDLNNDIPVTASDIGVGISQLMPLVVAALSRNKGIVACEQPELHVHPRVQVAIGDLLTQLDSSASFLIETHSEHLILRLLRRIRETSHNENPLNKNVSPNDISVVYLNPSDDGVKVIHNKVTSEGDFEKDWPQGFFEERYEEQ